MKLEWERVAGGVVFRVTEAGAALPADAWATAGALKLRSGALARIGVLLRLLEEGRAELVDTQVFVAEAEIAALDDAERAAVGLPRAASVTLELRASGAFVDPDFRVERRLYHANGTPVVSPNVDGCFLHTGGEQRTLAEPIYSLWRSVQDLNENAHDQETRLTAWARIRDRLPEGARLDDRLDSIRVHLATAFSLIPFLNAQGEPDFEPALGRWVERLNETGEVERLFEEGLPAAKQTDFATRFRALSDVKHRYSLGGNSFVVLSERTQRALRKVREIQKSDAGTRRRFLSRPSSALRDAFEAEAEALGQPPDDAIVDDVFFDEGLSERVKGVGVWEPKVLPWLKPSGESWIPEEVGLEVGGERFAVEPTKARELLDEIRRARAEGRDSVTFEGHRVPATEEAEKAVERIAEAVRGEKEPGSSDAKRSAERVALLIIDNLDQLGFRLQPRPVRSSADRLPQSLMTRLLPHQEQGFRWLREHWANGSPGALLADDMGLGKTLQALCFLAWLREQMDAGEWPLRPILVVAPTGLLRNWRDEHDKHLGGTGLGVVTEAYGAGLKPLRSAGSDGGRELKTGFPSLDVAALNRADWVTTTYETLRDYQHSFARVRWAAVVFDEAQKIKNPAAGVTDAAKAMKQDFVIAMTGTPVENRLEELWCIVDTARPGGVGSLKDFSERFRSLAGGDLQRELESLREELTAAATAAPMLRRLKEDHLKGLPSKTVHVHRREMPLDQSAAYRNAVIAAKSGAPVIEVLQRLRNVSLHPSPSSDLPDDELLGASARLSLAIEILDGVQDRGEKALVFLESRAVQDVLAEVLQRRYRLRERILIINGEVAGAGRTKRVKEFEARPGFDLMFLSPRAGGVGLTLTAANHVIHLARWWNPAVEDQCTDRVYRIGQERPVHVHQVLAIHPEFGDHSFDVRLDALLARKRTLNRSVLAPSAITEDDLKALYRDTVEDPA